MIIRSASLAATKELQAVSRPGTYCNSSLLAITVCFYTDHLPILRGTAFATSPCVIYGCMKNLGIQTVSKESNRPAKILIADDCEHSRNLIELALIEEGYELKICEDGNEALEAFNDFAPDMLILDVQMPGASGIEVCRWVKSHAACFTPTMLLTSQSELIDKVNGLDCGADEYVTKPFALPELAARTRALLRIKDLTNRLQETQSLLAHKERELVASQVAGAAAHELGQPLTAMLLNCQLLTKLSERSELQSKPELQGVLEQIEKQCKIMDHILKRLNEVDSYRTKSYVGQLEIVDLALGGES